jgi:polynucleotide 5'-kinase involved in rRNA processing
LKKQKSAFDVPVLWGNLLQDDLSGLIMIIGQTDTGKSTLAHYLFRQILSHNSGKQCIAYLDGDPGQTTHGPPTTITLVLDGTGSVEPRIIRSFIGSTTPHGHMLPMLTGSSRLVQAAAEAGAKTILFDTSGMIDSQSGGLSLKIAKIDLLQPKIVIAIQQDLELEALVQPLQKSGRTRVIVLPPSHAVNRKNQALRKANRQRQFSRHFAGSRIISIPWKEKAVLPPARFTSRRLLAFEDFQGFVLSMGIVIEANPPAREISVFTPLVSTEEVRVVRLGDMLVDPITFEHSQVRDRE